MKLRIKGFENDINISDSYGSILIVRDNKLFAKISLYLNEYSDHLNEILLLDNEEEIVKEKNIEVINDIMTYDINQKSLISKLYSMVELDVQCLDDYEDTFALNVSSINSIILDVLNEYNIDFDIDYNMDVIKYLKIF